MWKRIAFKIFSSFTPYLCSAYLADYFVIANGNSPLQVEAMVDSVQEELAKEGFEPKRVEGVHSSGWVLMDYGDRTSDNHYKTAA